MSVKAVEYEGVYKSNLKRTSKVKMQLYRFCRFRVFFSIELKRT